MLADQLVPQPDRFSDWPFYALCALIVVVATLSIILAAVVWSTREVRRIERQLDAD